MFSLEQLHQMLAEFRRMPAETEWLEFKEAKQTFDFDKLGEYFSALSNEARLKKQASGWLVFGIEDKRPRKIVGTQFRVDPLWLHKLKQEIASHANGLTFEEIYELSLPEGRVLMFQIPAAPVGMPTTWKGHFYGRNGESLGALSFQELDVIRQNITDWSAEICSGATIRHLDEKALQVAREKFLKKFPEERIQLNAGKWNPEVFLEKARLTKDGQLTRTTILLLGKPESSHFVGPHPAQVSWKLQTEEEAYEHFYPPFLLTADDVVKRIRNISFRLQPFNQLIPIELTKYDPKILLEALNNCLAHQDYRQNARINVIEKIDQVIMQSVGGFFDGTVEDYIFHERMPQNYRNPFLARAMVNLDMIDALGMGIRRMFLEQRKRYFPLPEYHVQDPNHVRIVIHGKLIDENYSRALIEKTDLSIEEVIALDRVQKKLPLSKEDTQLLRKKNLIEGRSPNIFVSPHIADIANHRDQYVKYVASQNAYHRKLILDFIAEHGSATRQEIDDVLKFKFPATLTDAQKHIKIGNLVSRLKLKKLIQNRGTKKQPKWFLKK